MKSCIVKEYKEKITSVLLKRVGTFYGQPTLKQHLVNPQSLNSYAYTLNNPIGFTDPDGEIVPFVALAAIAATVVIDQLTNVSMYDHDATPEQIDATEQKIIKHAVVGVATPSGAARSGGQTVARVVQNRIKGMNFEERIRSMYDIGKATQLTIDGVKRIPDGLNRAARQISEIKNVANLSYTAQLQDFANFAKAAGFDFYLYVAAHTKLSAPLQRAVDSGEIILRRISPE